MNNETIREVTNTLANRLHALESEIIRVKAVADTRLGVEEDAKECRTALLTIQKLCEHNFLLNGYSNKRMCKYCNASSDIEFIRRS
jgi:hypothetical protein